MVIARIRIMQVLPNLERRQVFVCRVNMANMDADAQDALMHGIATQWMRQNPGVPTQAVMDWPNVKELGEKHVWKLALD